MLRIWVYTNKDIVFFSRETLQNVLERTNKAN